MTETEHTTENTEESKGKFLAITFLVLGFIGDVVGNIIVNKAPQENPLGFYLFCLSLLSLSSIAVALSAYHLLDISGRKDWLRNNLKFFSFATITLLVLDFLYVIVNAAVVLDINITKYNSFISRTHVNVPLLVLTVTLLLFTIKGHSIKRIYAFTASKIHDLYEFLAYRDDAIEGPVQQLIEKALDDQDDKFSSSEMKKVIKKIHDTANSTLMRVAEDHKNQIILVKNFLCDNQGWLADYIFTLSSGHKKLKEALTKGTNELDRKFPKGKKKTQREKEALELVESLKPLATRYRDESRLFLAEICRKNSDHLREVFRLMKNNKPGRGASPPRITVKGYNSKQDLAMDIFRVEKTYGGQSRASENSAFKEILKHGRYYLCNDIPEAASRLTRSKNEYQYLNPRLSNKRVIEHNKTLANTRKTDDDELWKDCWTSNVEGLEPPLEACYRSTLVIPITLLNNELSKEFRNHFQIPMPTDQSLARAILGCIGIDHLERNYFHEELDREIGYYFADVISLYLITYLTYVDYSTTFNAILPVKDV